MKYTLLELVQLILSSMDSDEVDSINDTVESQQVAYAVRSAYYRIAASADLPEHNAVFNLEASNTSTPVVMYRPSNVTKINNIKYNRATITNPDPNFTFVTPLSQDRFFEQIHQLSLSADNVSEFSLVANDSDLKVLYRTDKHPDYYTTLDDNIILFDSLSTSVDANLQSSKTMCTGSVYKAFTLSDGFIPNLNPEQFDLLLNEAKSWCHAELKQSQNPKAEQAARRGWINLQRTKDAVKLHSYYTDLPDYGRK